MTTPTPSRRGPRFPLTRLQRIQSGKIIRDLRIQQDLTQTELAQKIGYKNQANISHIETGLKSIPPAKLSAAAAVMGVEPKDILDLWDE